MPRAALSLSSPVPFSSSSFPQIASASLSHPLSLSSSFPSFFLFSSSFSLTAFSTSLRTSFLSLFFFSRSLASLPFSSVASCSCPSSSGFAVWASLWLPSWLPVGALVLECSSWLVLVPPVCLGLLFVVLPGAFSCGFFYLRTLGIPSDLMFFSASFHWFRPFLVQVFVPVVPLPGVVDGDRFVSLCPKLHALKLASLSFYFFFPSSFFALLPFSASLVGLIILGGGPLPLRLIAVRGGGGVFAMALCLFPGFFMPFRLLLLSAPSASGLLRGGGPFLPRCLLYALTLMCVILLSRRRFLFVQCLGSGGGPLLLGWIRVAHCYLLLSWAARCL